MRGKGSWRAGYETIGRFRMYYRDWRPAGGEKPPAVIALHGSLIQGGMWVSVAEGVGSARMVCPDQRGYGLSEDPADGEAAADFARDAIALANALMLDRFTIMGHSFAYAIALEVARMEPGRVAAAVLVDPTVHDPSAHQRSLARAADRPVSFPSLAEAARWWRANEEGAWPAAGLKRFLREAMTSDGEGGPCRAPYTQERLLRLRTFQASPASDYGIGGAGQVKCPVLIFRGGVSKRLSTEAERRLKKALPNGARAVLMKKSGHFPWVSEPKRFHDALRTFLAKTK
jgi:pimeloyl-ACP methyl ester carboxylesterase